MRTLSISRTGMSRLTFDGEMLSSSEGRCRHNRDHYRWHNISLYRTKGGSYVVATEYHTISDQEENRSTAEVCKTASEVAPLLRSYDPEEGVQMPSASDPDSVKTLRDLRRRFEAQVSEVLADHPEFEERID